MMNIDTRLCSPLVPVPLRDIRNAGPDAGDDGFEGGALEGMMVVVVRKPEQVVGDVLEVRRQEPEVLSPVY